MNYADARQEIRAALDRIDIVDHHEHMGGQFREGAFALDLPAFMCRYYLLADLTSAGLPAEFRGPAAFSYLQTPDHDDVTQQRWNTLLPYLKRVKNTIYYRYLLIALRELFGMDAEEVDEIDDWKALSDRIRDANKNSAEWASSVLDRTNIKHILLDLGWLNSGWWQRDRIPRLVEDNCFHRVVRCDPFVVGDQRFAEAVSGNPVYSFDQYLDALDAAFQVAITEGVKGLKSTLAYRRIIHYEDVPRADAERAWAAGLNNVSAAGHKAFQDFMMHQVLARCAEHNLPIQIHTGIQAGNFNTITNAKPTHLTNLFQKFPTVRFDIFHGGYPYCQEAGLLAKYFPNVYIDGCWLAHISPAAYTRALDEWIEIVPSNKIFAWGGDHRIVELTYASLMLAKDLIADVLARKVANAYFTMKVALDLLEKIMGKNGIDFYRL